MQYELISKQFKCIADYLNWEIMFDKTFSAYGKDDLKNSSNAMEKMINIGKSILTKMHYPGTNGSDSALIFCFIMQLL